MKIIAHIVDDVCKEMKHMLLLEEIQRSFGSNKNKEDGVVNGDKTYFGSDPKEGHRSDMKSPFGIHNVAEHKNTSIGCESKYLVEDQATISPPHEEKTMMQTNEKSSYFCIPLYHDEFDTKKEVKIRFK